MKHLLYLMLLLGSPALAQTQETQQLLLNVEKLAQFKQILQDMKSGYQLLSSGYRTIKDLSEGNFSLHKSFIDGLMQVSPSVRKYKRVADILAGQLSLLRDYKKAGQRLRATGLFSEQELRYTAGVYSRLIASSLQNLEELAMVITAGKLRMSDQERISEINRIYLQGQDQLEFLRSFNHQTAAMALQRNKDKQEVLQSRAAYAISQTN